MLGERTHVRRGRAFRRRGNSALDTHPWLRVVIALRSDYLASIGPYEHVLRMTPAAELNAADIGDVTLAPHAIYTRHDEIYVDALTLDRNGKPPREEKMGTFKLAGLGALRLTPRRFTASALFERDAEKYQGAALMMVEPG